MFGNKKRKRKEKRRIIMLSFVWFIEGKEMRRKIYDFLFLYPHEIESNKFEILDKGVISLT